MIQALQKDKNCYQINGAILIKYQGSKDKAAFIPHGVTKIGENAFEGCENLSIILLPETVTKIQHGAFKGCVNLKHINIPTSVIYIGEGVFDGCENLESLYIPDSVQKCHLLGHMSVGYMRIPLKLWNKGILADTKIWNLVLGLPEEIQDIDSLFDMRVFDLMEWSRPRICFEVTGSEYTNGCSSVLGAFTCVDGSIIQSGDYETPKGDEYYDVLINLADSVLAIPSNVEVLDYQCVGQGRLNLPLYIPDSVEYIHPKAFELWAKPMLVTPASNFKHLEKILPSSLSAPSSDDVVKIYVI